MSEVPGITDYLQQATAFMQANDIEAVIVQGKLDDGRRYQGISFLKRPDEIGQVRYVGGELLEEDITEHERRVCVQGFITEVVRPVQRAVSGVYAEGSDLLDERLDPLLGTV